MHRAHRAGSRSRHDMNSTRHGGCGRRDHRRSGARANRPGSESVRRGCGGYLGRGVAATTGYFPASAGDVFHDGVRRSGRLRAVRGPRRFPSDESGVNHAAVDPRCCNPGDRKHGFPIRCFFVNRPRRAWWRSGGRRNMDDGWSGRHNGSGWVLRCRSASVCHVAVERRFALFERELHLRRRRSHVTGGDQAEARPHLCSLDHGAVLVLDFQ